MQMSLLLWEPEAPLTEEMGRFGGDASSSRLNRRSGHTFLATSAEVRGLSSWR
jgi:hypothetical protein